MIVNVNYGGLDFFIVFSNKGIGLVIVDFMIVIYKDLAYQMDLLIFFYQEVFEFSEVSNIYYFNIVLGQFIFFNERIEIFKVDNLQESIDQFLQLLMAIDIDYWFVY